MTNGLKAEYYDNIDLTNFKLTRIDSTVNFNWGEGSPDPSIGTNSFSVRWTGQVQPKYSETYRFYVTRDNGAKLWVNNQLLIDKWFDTSNVTDSGTIPLTAGQKYNIKLEYFENSGGANVRLEWSSPSQPKQVIPQSQLYTPSVTYQAPITITRGGTYRGNWQSLDANVPAVKVSTTEPVIIENSTIRSRGHLIFAIGHTKVTVRNSKGYGLNPNIAGRAPGRFFQSEEFDNVVLENNYLEATSGIYLRKYVGSPITGHTVKILRNRIRNIDGRHSNGAGGFSLTGFNRVQFVQFNDVKSVPGIEVAWNEVINEPYKSRVEDNISVYLSSGTSSSPMQIHNNYIQGGYPTNPAKDGYSGGGIITDGRAPTVGDAAAYARIHGNHVVNTTNYGIAIAHGHNNEFCNNRVISSSYLADGTYIAAQNVGTYITADPADLTDGTFFNNHSYGNVIGWVNKGANYAWNSYRNDQYLPVNGSDYARNTKLPNPITLDTEKAEFQVWKNKVTSNKLVIGPNF